MFDRDEMEEPVEEVPKTNTVKKYTCSSCGSVFCSTSPEKIESCVFCGRKTLELEEHIEDRNLTVVPFMKTLEDAQADYHKKTFWNPLIPLTFKGRRKKKSIKKLFLPAYLVSANQSGRVLFLGGEKETVTKGGKKRVELKKYDVYQNINIDYKRVLLNVFTKIDEKIFMNICDYSFENTKGFVSRDFSDCSYVLANVPASEVGEKGREKLLKHSLAIVRNNVRHPLRKLKQDDSTIVFHNAKEVLIPVFLLNVSYGRRNYQYIMNGENGKSYMELPVGIFATIFFSLFVCSIVFGIAYLIAYYL